MKTANYHKRGGWDGSLGIRILFEDGPTRLGQPLRMEMSNKQGVYVLKIRCCICRTLISYHNNPWMYAATHILSHNVPTPQDIVVATVLAAECEANGEPIPILSYQLHLQ